MKKELEGSVPEYQQLTDDGYSAERVYEEVFFLQYCSVFTRHSVLYFKCKMQMERIF